MNYRRLGQTGLKVSEISLGSWLTYGGYIEKEQAIKTIHQAYDLGINFFDTANVYMRGESEKVVGEAIKNFKREDYVLATKVFFPMGEGPNDKGLSRKHITQQAEASLQRLNVEYVDVYYAHRYDDETNLEETLRAFDDLVRQGKVHYIGVSEWTPAQITEAVQIADRRLLDRIVVNQPQYNLLHRHIEQEVIPVSEKYGIGQVVWSPLAQGILTGKYSEGHVPAGSRATANQPAFDAIFNEDNLRKAQQLAQLAQEADLTATQLALAWILRQPNVASALVGASNPQQLIESSKASGVVLAQDVLQKIEEILNQSTSEVSTW